MEEIKSYRVIVSHIISGSKQTFDSVVFDDVMSIGGVPMPFRVLLLENKERIEFPMDQFLVHFSAERQLSAEARALAEAKAKTENT